ncbi:MAG: GatB/YqeY domain-containing protein [Acidobacteriota bacterium]
MSLSERVQEDLVGSMKRKDTARVNVLRMMKAALKNKEIEKRKPLSDGEAIDVLKWMLKRQREAIEKYEAGGRPDLAEKERGEEAVITSYLPEPVSTGEIEKVIAGVIQERGASGLKDMGAVMKETMARLRSTGKTVDGKVVSAMVRAQLERVASPGQP